MVGKFEGYSNAEAADAAVTEGQRLAELGERTREAMIRLERGIEAAGDRPGDPAWEAYVGKVGAYFSVYEEAEEWEEKTQRKIVGLFPSVMDNSLAAAEDLTAIHDLLRSQYLVQLGSALEVVNTEYFKDNCNYQTELQKELTALQKEFKTPYIVKKELLEVGNKASAFVVSNARALEVVGDIGVRAVLAENSFLKENSMESIKLCNSLFTRYCQAENSHLNPDNNVLLKKVGALDDALTKLDTITPRFKKFDNAFRAWLDVGGEVPLHNTTQLKSVSVEFRKANVECLQVALGFVETRNFGEHFPNDQENYREQLNACLQKLHGPSGTGAKATFG